jgi:MOSC domain-containing protein YiiM
MSRGILVAIYVAPEAGAPMQSVDAVRAVAGRGLEGDRYFDARGSFSRWPGPHREVSLIAEEGLAAMAEATGATLPPAQSRRNLLTRGVALETLIGEEFLVGDVRLRGIRRCQPCKYLARLTETPEVLPGLVGRGGLRARILDGGTVCVGDAIQALSKTP